MSQQRQEKLWACSKVGYWFLGCSLVLIARMVGLHSYGFLNLKQQNARRTGTLIPLCYYLLFVGRNSRQ